MYVGHTYTYIASYIRVTYRYVLHFSFQASAGGLGESLNIVT